jgi:hypothetical protein
MSPKLKPPNVGEAQVLCDQEAVFRLRGREHRTVISASQSFVIYRVHVMSKPRQEPLKSARDVLAKLEAALDRRNRRQREILFCACGREGDNGA